MKANRSIFIPIAWVVALLVSLLPDILFRELSGSLPAWLYWAKVGLIFVLLVAALFWQRLRPLGLFLAVLLVVYLLEKVLGLPAIQGRISLWLIHAVPFVQEVGQVELTRGLTSLLLVLAMLGLFRSFSRFFLVKGDLRAPAGPIPLIVSRPPRWNILGPAIAAAMCLGLLVFTFAFGSLPSSQGLRNVGPLL